MQDLFNAKWNEHYNFDDRLNIEEIEKVDSYDLLADRNTYVAGEDIVSPWGKNRVVELWSDTAEYCRKNIIINPGYMLSLQRHRGREETWKVLDGVLTVICNGQRYDLSQGQEIFIPQGAPHCMINAFAETVAVEEIQKGICREADNIRLMDFARRPTYPFTSDLEYRSGCLYADISSSISKR